LVIQSIDTSCHLHAGYLIDTGDADIKEPALLYYALNMVGPLKNSLSKFFFMMSFMSSFDYYCGDGKR
jgi:hypothetical protein